jgi:CheY-like chemotaxis protein
MRVYCISCGEEVDAKTVSIGIEGQDLLKCPHCNSFLGTMKSPQTLAQPAPAFSLHLVEPPEPPPTDFSGDDAGNPSEMLSELPAGVSALSGSRHLLEESLTEASEPPIDTIVLAEDTALIREMLKDSLVERRLSHRVVSCRNGYEFLSAYIRSRQGGPEQRGVGLVILDVVMPILNGVSAAVALRAHEKGLGLSAAPILFFTSKRCDETFKKVLTFCQPAMYVNKGGSSSPEHLQQRVDKVITQLLKESW